MKTITLSEYIPEEMIKSIAETEVREAFRRELKDENAIKRILTNVAYDLVWKKVDEVLTEDHKQLLEKKVHEIIGSKFSVFNIFKKPDAWDRETNTAYEYLKNAIDGNKKRIKTSVNKIIDEQLDDAALSVMREEIKDVMYEHVENLFKVKSNT